MKVNRMAVGQGSSTFIVRMMACPRRPHRWQVVHITEMTWSWSYLEVSVS